MRLYVQVTEQCDLACRHCGFDCRPGDAEPIRPETLAGFLGSLPRAPSHVALTGGEPMLDVGRVLELTRLARARGAVVRLITNAGWARGARETEQLVRALGRAGIRGLWISAGLYHDEQSPFNNSLNLLRAARRIGIACHLNYVYLWPQQAGMRGKGLPAVDARVGDDVRTLALQRQQVSVAVGQPGAGGLSSGWSRMWDRGRARKLIDALGAELAAGVRADLLEAERAQGPSDLVGLGKDGRLLCSRIEGFGQAALP
ncbi:MAG: radical SAM protein [Deltaproteobacteria bacterium]|nr:radical SAM protein [Deltaproteobacteria bacterium]